MLNPTGNEDLTKLIMSSIQVLPLFLEIVVGILRYTGSVKINEPSHEITNNVVSEHVQHKPSCASKGDGKSLEIFNSDSAVIALSM